MKKGLLTLFVLVSILINQGVRAQEDMPKQLDKGTGYFGVLFSYSKNVKENVKNLLENTKYSTAVSTSTNMAGGYFFKKNFAVGMGVTFDSKKDEAESINTFGPNTLSNAELYSW